MTRKTYIAIASAALCAAVLTGCQKDGWFKGKTGDGNLAFEATVSAQKGNPVRTKAGVISGNGLEIPLSCRIEDGIGGLSANSVAATKGTLLNTTGETKPLNDYIETFTVNGWNADGSEFISGEGASWNSTSQKWVPGTVTAWTGASEKTFYAWANLPSSGASVTNEDNGAFKLTVTELPQDAKDQTDVILGWYNGKGDSDGDGLTDGVASLAFSHPLTSVVFVRGQMDGVTGIKKIAITGVYGSADCAASFAQTAGAVTPTYTWSNFGERTSTILSAEETLPIDEETNAIGEPFILIPQDLSAAAVKLSVTVTTSKGPSVMTTTIDSGVWASGKTAVYTLGYTDVLRAEPLCFSATEPQSITLPQIETTDMEDFMLGAGTVKMAEGVNLSYSYDEETWTEWEDFLEPLEFGTLEHPVIFLRGDNPNGLGNEVIIHEEYREEYDEYEEDFEVKASKFVFGNSADVVVSGNIMSLLDPTCKTDSFAEGVESPFFGLFAASPIADASNLILPAAEVPFGAYALMFVFNDRLTSAPELPATVIGDWAYAAMFEMCALEKAPDIPATSVGRCACCYMFSMCEIMTMAPAILPAMELGERCYTGMFSDTRITNAPKLPATTLKNACYMKMFEDSEIHEAPELPATTLKNACYKEMFEGSEIHEAPELPATTLAPSCYYEMFYYCENMTKGPSVLPAEEMERRACHRMFAYCNKLATAPKLKATILAEECYSAMFEYCKALKIAPEISAETMAKRSCYGMFNYCENLTDAPVEIPAETLAEECCSNMFSGCQKLKNATYIPATTMATNCFAYMYNYCRELTSVPALPATTLAEGCYRGMFASCEMLETAPVLPAETLTAYCYYGMFGGCHSLNYIKMLATDITAEGCLSNWTGYSYWWDSPSSIATTGTFVKSALLETGDGTNQIPLDNPSGIPTGWTVVNELI